MVFLLAWAEMELISDWLQQVFGLLTPSDENILDFVFEDLVNSQFLRHFFVSQKLRIKCINNYDVKASLATNFDFFQNCC